MNVYIYILYNIYIHIYIYIYIYTCVYMCIYIHTYIYVYYNNLLCIYIYIYSYSYACTRRLTSRTVLELGSCSVQRISSEKALTTCTSQSPSSAAMRPLTLVVHRQNPWDLDSSRNNFILHCTASLHHMTAADLSCW